MRLRLRCPPRPASQSSFFPVGGFLPDVSGSPRRLRDPASIPGPQVPRPRHVGAVVGAPRARGLALRPRNPHNRPLRGRREDVDGHHGPVRRQPSDAGTAGLGRSVRPQRRYRPICRRGRPRAEELLFQQRAAHRGHPRPHALVDGAAPPLVFETVDGGCKPTTAAVGSPCGGLSPGSRHEAADVMSVVAWVKPRSDRSVMSARVKMDT